MFRKFKFSVQFLAILLMLSVVLVGCTSGSQESDSDAAYPEKGKTVTIIVERAAGGGSDLIARAIAPLLEKELGIPVIVVNKTGGDGVVGLNEAANAAPDGYTLDLSADTVQAIHSVIYDNTDYTEDSWEYLAATNMTSYIMILPKESQFKTLEEVIEYAIENPERLTLGTPSGVAEVMSALEVNTGAKFTQIVNDSGANNLASIAGGHVDVGLLTAQFYQQAIDQDLNVIGVMSPERLSTTPDVPTFKEVGYDVEIVQNWILIMPEGASEEVLSTLGTAIENVGNSPEFIESLEAINAIPNFKHGDEAKEYIMGNIKAIKKDLETWNNK